MNRRPLAFSVVVLSLVAVGAFLVTSSQAASPTRATLPQAGVTAACGEDSPHAYGDPGHPFNLEGVGTFQEVSVGTPIRLMVEAGRSFVSKAGLKTVSLRVLTIGGQGFAEGIGETRFWLDATRPVKGAIWEKRAGTEFPAIQELRFHVFYTFEALPGKVFRTVTPVVMRSNHVRAFPPPPGTVYNMVGPVSLEDTADPGPVIGRLLANRVVVPEGKPTLFN